MFLQSIRLRSFRNLQPGEIEFDAGLNVFLGENGQGKTNLLEAIYALATSKSFRTSRLSDCVQHGQTGFSLHGKIQVGDLCRQLALSWSAGVKELRINEKVVSALQYLGNLDVLVVSFDQLPIVRGGPEERRRFLDAAITLVRKGYLRMLAEFHHVLRQRNSVLAQIREGKAGLAELEAWEAMYAGRALMVSVEREEQVRRLNETLSAVSFSPDQLELRYVSSLEARDLVSVRYALDSNRAADIRLGKTQKGPHRDELKILLENREIQKFGSGGQQRSAVFSLLFATACIYFAEKKGFPVFLIDDLDAELDVFRLGALLERLQGERQVFVSTAKENVAKSIVYGNRIIVQNGRAARISSA